MGERRCRQLFNFVTDENHLLARFLPQLIQLLILHCERVYVYLCNVYGNCAAYIKSQINLFNTALIHAKAAEHCSFKFIPSTYVCTYIIILYNAYKSYNMYIVHIAYPTQNKIRMKFVFAFWSHATVICWSIYT